MALKFIPKARMGSAAAATLVSTEIHALTALQHPNVIKLNRVLNQERHVVLVFEYAEGGSLYEYIKDVAPAGRLGEREARHGFRQILSGVAGAHRRHICHGDLKLENILIAQSSTTPSDEPPSPFRPSSEEALNGTLAKPAGLEGVQLKVADFGLSAFYDGRSLSSSSSSSSSSKTAGGSLHYLPPEFFTSSHAAGPPLDVWSLGVILYAMVTGKLPFDNAGNTIRKRGKTGEKRGVVIKRIKRAAPDFSVAKFVEDDAGVTAATVAAAVAEAAAADDGDQIVQAKLPLPAVSAELKSLITAMLRPEAEQRLTIAEIFAHPWMSYNSFGNLSGRGQEKGKDAEASRSASPGTVPSAAASASNSAAASASATTPIRGRRSSATEREVGARASAASSSAVAAATTRGAGASKKSRANSGAGPGEPSLRSKMIRRRSTSGVKKRSAGLRPPLAVKTSLPHVSGAQSSGFGDAGR